jgi:hypothetical protein
LDQIASESPWGRTTIWRHLGPVVRSRAQARALLLRDPEHRARLRAAAQRRAAAPGFAEQCRRGAARSAEVRSAQVDPAAALQLYEQGMPVWKVAAELGVGKSTAQRALVAAGYVPRPSAGGRPRVSR